MFTLGYHDVALGAPNYGEQLILFLFGNLKLVQSRFHVHQKNVPLLLCDIKKLVSFLHGAPRVLLRSAGCLANQGCEVEFESR